jgi:hypothetical protein|tara:strand:- start:2968 stop:3228 length:261 start_codon:yes stop_codon:yes gene_type:complete
MHDRQKDFQLIFLMKEPDSYLFTAESNHYKPLDRVVIARDVNKMMREVSNQLPGKLNITSHTSELAISHSYGKIPKILNLLNKRRS